MPKLVLLMLVLFKRYSCTRRLMALRKTALQNRSKFLPNIIDSVFRVAGNHRTRRAAIECSEENKPFVSLDD